MAKHREPLGQQHCLRLVKEFTLKRLLTLAVLALALPSAAGAQATSGIVTTGSFLPSPFSDAATSSTPSVIAGPVFATVIQTGLPCFGCVVPPKAKAPVAFSFGTSAPVDTIATAQKTSQYIVYFQNDTCPAPKTGNNITISFVLSAAGKVLDSASISGNIPAGDIGYYPFNRNRPKLAKTGAALLTGTVNCLAPKASSSDGQALYFM